MWREPCTKRHRIMMTVAARAACTLRWVCRFKARLYALHLKACMLCITAHSQANLMVQGCSGQQQAAAAAGTTGAKPAAPSPCSRTAGLENYQGIF